MTASRTWRSRSFRDATMSLKLLPANNLDRPPRAGQVADEGVEAKPTLGATHHALPLQLYPPLTPPGGQPVRRTDRPRHSRGGPQREIKAIQLPMRLSEDRLSLTRRQPGSNRAPLDLT